MGVGAGVGWLSRGIIWLEGLEIARIISFDSEKFPAAQLFMIVVVFVLHHRVYLHRCVTHDLHTTTTTSHVRCVHDIPPYSLPCVVCTIVVHILARGPQFRHDSELDCYSPGPRNIIVARLTTGQPKV